LLIDVLRDQLSTFAQRLEAFDRREPGALRNSGAPSSNAEFVDLDNPYYDSHFRPSDTTVRFQELLAKSVHAR